jgi:hypothetical protein
MIPAQSDQSIGWPSISNRLKRADMTVSDNAPGPKESVWLGTQDATCVESRSRSFVRATYVPSTSLTALPGRRLPKLRRRRRTYTPICQANTCFVLLPSRSRVETFGSSGEEALQLVSELGGRLRSTT